MRFKYLIGPTTAEIVAYGVCDKLARLPANERCCVYDSLLFRLRQRDKGVAEALEKHWNDHLNPRL